MDTVSKDVSVSGLQLDGRSISELLNFFRSYCGEIPFAGTGTESGNWADFFFQGHTPASLAALYSDIDTADGSLAPQQAFMLAFFGMLETQRSLLNRLPGMHRDLYYRTFLGLEPRSAIADQVVVAFTVDSRVDEVAVPADTLLDAGQDAQGQALQYALNERVLANQGRWSDLRWTVPSSEGSGSILARTVFDEEAGLPWPDAGVRLFGNETGESAAARGVVAASPLLDMSGGTRVVTLHFGSAIVPSLVNSAFVSSTDEWIPLTLKSTGDTALTEIEYELSAQAGAVTAPQGLDGLSDDVPLVKVLYTGTDALPIITLIDVAVDGLTDVSYATDDSAERAGRRSFPFGNSALVGSSFTLAAADWYGKDGIALTITVQPEWIGLPEPGFPDWYAGYPNQPANNNEFIVQTSLATAGGRSPAGSGSQPLFAAGTGAPEGAVIVVEGVTAFRGTPSDSADPRDWPQWLRFELSPRDFLSREYQQQIASNPDLNLPYTPQVGSMAVGWRGSAAPVRSYQLTPFGFTQAADTVNDTGPMLYLGFAGLKAGQDLSLYWKLRSSQALQLSWQYLDLHNEWTSMDALVSDGTGALFDSGRWSIALPHDATDQGSQMPSGRLWIRAAITPPALAADDAATSYPWLYDVLANAATATLQDAASIDASHFETPLPAETITRTTTSLDGIAEVQQPWPSTGGQPPESDEEFYERIAHRLLHRDRAVTWNDMVMLLQDRFPEVFAVYVPSIKQLAILPPPRQQVVVVVPATGNADTDDPLRPTFSASRLAAMQEYLQSRASLWMDIVVRNPEFREVEIAYEIVFATGVNPDYGYRLLKEELISRYMPWSLAGGGGAVLGNRIDYYDMVAWIQQRPYVSRVVKLTLDGATVSVQGGDVEELILTWPKDATRRKLERSPS